jgi:hypothetical protein
LSQSPPKLVEEDEEQPHLSERPPQTGTITVKEALEAQLDQRISVDDRLQPNKINEVLQTYMRKQLAIAMRNTGETGYGKKHLKALKSDRTSLSSSNSSCHRTVPINPDLIGDYTVQIDMNNKSALFGARRSLFVKPD